MQQEIIHHLTTHDVVLAPVIAEVDWPEFTSTQNVFHDLMSCVIEQQIHYRSTKKIFARLLEKAFLEELTPDNFEQLEEVLDEVKLSMKKYQTVVEVVDFFQGHSPDWSRMSDKEVRETLGTIPGVGPWTVDMILLYTLERPDVFPLQDFHLKKVMKQLYALEDKGLSSSMKAIAAKWSPYRSYGVKYLLVWKQAQKQQKR